MSNVSVSNVPAVLRESLGLKTPLRCKSDVKN
jgi:hypothetical protein